MGLGTDAPEMIPVFHHVRTKTKTDPDNTLLILTQRPFGDIPILYRKFKASLANLLQGRGSDSVEQTLKEDEARSLSPRPEMDFVFNPPGTPGKFTCSRRRGCSFLFNLVLSF